MTGVDLDDADLTIVGLRANSPVAVQARTVVLLRLCGDFIEEADASLQATYAPRDPMAEFLHGRISARQLRVLLEGLPVDSAFHRAHRGYDWSDSDWIAWDSNSQLRGLTAMLSAYFAQEKKVTPPKLLPTPLDGKTVKDEAEEQRHAAERREMDALMGRVFANN